VDRWQTLDEPFMAMAVVDCRGAICRAGGRIPKPAVGRAWDARDLHQWFLGGCNPIGGSAGPVQNYASMLPCRAPGCRQTNGQFSVHFRERRVYDPHLRGMTQIQQAAHRIFRDAEFLGHPGLGPSSCWQSGAWTSCATPAVGVGGNDSRVGRQGRASEGFPGRQDVPTSRR
jgi:hypothetical protein